MVIRYGLRPEDKRHDFEEIPQHFIDLIRGTCLIPDNPNYGGVAHSRCVDCGRVAFTFYEGAVATHYDYHMSPCRSCESTKPKILAVGHGPDWEL